MCAHERNSYPLWSCVVPLSCSEKRTSRPSLIPCGVFLDLTSQLADVNDKLIKTGYMSWMVRRLFDARHGLAVLHTRTLFANTLNMQHIFTETP